MTQILDGKSLRNQRIQEMIGRVNQLSRPPHLVVLLTHPNHASSIYVKHKQQACQEAGITSTLIEKPCRSTEEVCELIHTWNKDTVDGILLQLPLHPNIDQQKAINSIPPHKDVDGLHPENLGKLVSEDPSGFIPCTALGIQQLLIHYQIPLQGRHVLIVGRSIIVGKPLALLLSQRNTQANATVTIAHSRTTNLSSLCRSAHIIIAATGSPHLITKDMITSGSVIVDVGISRTKNNKLCGDVDFENIAPLAAAISPVPGGVGPMTIASLLFNTLKSAEQR